MSTSAAVERQLVLAGGPKDRHWLGKLKGRAMTQLTWVDGGKAKETVKHFPDAQKARDEFWKAVRAKMRAGYVFRRDAAEAGPGDVVLEAYAPTRLDLSFDGRTVLTGVLGVGGRGCRLVLIDVATGARRVVHTEPAGPQQTVLHAALFDRTGEAVYFQLNGDTYRLDLQSGARTQLAGYAPYQTANFSLFGVRPCFDAARRRLLVFDKGSVARVLEGGRTVLEVSTHSPTTLCEAGALSPSGRLLALYRVSRGLVYFDKDAQHDSTNEVEVWDVERGQLWARVPLAEELDHVGIDPQDRQLLVTQSGSRGPVAYALPSGRPAWRLHSFWKNDRLGDCYDWDFSPDGSLLATAGDRLRLYGVAKGGPTPLADLSSYQAVQAIFSGDGRLLASAVAGTVEVRKVGVTPPAPGRPAVAVHVCRGEVRART